MARKRTEDYLAELSSEHSPEPERVEVSTVEEVIEDRVEIPTPFGFDEAANILLQRLDPPIRDYAIEVADLVLKIPRWQLLLGTVMAQYQSGALVAPYIDPSWQAQQVVESSGKCERCGKDFTPHKLRQRFCSNECGSLWIRESYGVNVRP